MGEDAPDTVEQGFVLSVSEIDPTMARPVRAVPGHNWGPFQIADPRRRVWQHEKRDGDAGVRNILGLGHGRGRSFHVGVNHPALLPTGLGIRCAV